MLNFDKMTEEELRNNLMSLYYEVKGLAGSSGSNSKFEDDIKRYKHTSLISECKNLSNIVNTVKKSKVLGKDLGFQFYLKTRAGGEGLSIVLYNTKMWNRNADHRLELNIPHNWNHIQIDPRVFLFYNSKIILRVKSFNQLDLGEEILNNHKVKVIIE